MPCMPMVDTAQGDTTAATTEGTPAATTEAATDDSTAAATTEASPDATKEDTTAVGEAATGGDATKEDATTDGEAAAGGDAAEAKEPEPEPVPTPTPTMEIVPDYEIDTRPLPVDTMARVATESPVKRKTRAKAVMEDIHTRKAKTDAKKTELKKENADDATKEIQWMGENIASMLGIDRNTTITQLMENGDVKKIEQFFKPASSRVLVFFYQVTDKYGGHKDADKPRVFVANPALDKVGGRFVYCYKTSAKQITNSDIAREVYFGATEGKAEASVLDNVSHIMRSLLIPSLRSNGNWGKMVSTDTSKEQLFSSMDRVVTSLNQAKSAVSATISLTEFSEEEANGFTFDKLRTTAAIKEASQDPKKIAKIEILVGRWCDQISHVLTVNEQIRSEHDDAGPSVELTHWKKRMAIFNALANETDKPDCVAAIGVLQMAKSKVTARWNTMDISLTDKANESKDNVMYLQKLENECAALYRTDLHAIEESLPAIMHVIGNIHSVSRYYNTNERMTALFIKVTNQLITSCREFVYEKEPRIWEQTQEDALDRLAKVKHLHHEYLRFFEIEKQRLEETPERNQFNFPAMGVFGKSDSFIARVKTVEKMLAAMDNWTKLSRSQIDGLEVISTMVKGTIKMIKQKPYDPLDIRCLEFDGDQASFFTSMNENRVRLQEFCDKLFQSNEINRRIQLHTDFEQIKFLGIELYPHYTYTLEHVFAQELDHVRRTYLADRDAPPISRNMPPLAGRVAWSRNLSMRLEQPIQSLNTLCPALFKEPCHQKLIKQYNKVGSVLVKFEQVCWEAWSRATTTSLEGLKGSVILVDGDGNFVINRDPQVGQLVSESSWMGKLKLELTESSVALCKQSHVYEDQVRRLEGALDKHHKLIKRIPDALQQVLTPMKNELMSTFEPGMRSLNWLSTNLDDYIDSVFDKLVECKNVLDTILDLVDVRIDNKLEEIRTTDLCAMPAHGEAFTISEFENQSAAESTRSALVLEDISRQVERSVNGLLDKINVSISSDQRADPVFVASCDELKKSYVVELGAAITKCIRSSLDHLKRRAGQKLMAFGKAMAKPEDPIISASCTLSLPSGAIMAPTLDGIQQGVVAASKCIIKVADSVLLWGQDRTQDAATLNSHAQLIKINKEITRGMESISTVINATKGSLDDVLSRFDQYGELWKDSIEETLAKFTETKPDLSSFTEAIQKYEDMDIAIEAMEETIPVGSMLLHTHDFKLALQVETASWKSAYAKLLNQKTQKDMEELFTFADETIKKMSRPIEDLEDVRLAMNSLKDIRENEIRLDAMMAPIEAGYAMLVKNNVKISSAEQDQLDSMRFQWEKMRKQGAELGTHLVKIQPDFKTQLVASVKQFGVDQKAFLSDYNIKGPMVDGIAPSEASDRLEGFQKRFDELYKRYVTYNGGEGLFGLTQTEYPDLMVAKKELNLLQKLYSLYNSVIKSVNGYYDIKWIEVDIEFINNQLLDFSNKCRKLPKALKEWDAYLELQKKIDDFSESLPLLEAMASDTMLDRHWKRIQDTCDGYVFDVKNGELILFPYVSHVCGECVRRGAACSIILKYEIYLSAGPRLFL